ncbi:uncharacterized protein [Clytia hemisphaerica]|uniref:Kinetochore protein SPC25 n=1 Tax=Clytia hemisphaerica TaxID=252671 RepID=A0A7M5XGP5_9CNID
MFSATSCDDIDTLLTQGQKKQCNFSNWTEQSRDFLLKQKTSRILETQKNQEDMKQIQQETEEFIKISKITEFSNAQANDIQCLSEELVKLKAQSCQKNLLSKTKAEKLEENQNTVKQKSEEVADTEKNVAKHLEKLEKGLSFFEEHLGLKVLSNPDDHLTFKFTKIDEMNQDKEFSFNLAVEGSPGKYTVSDYSVPIPDLEVSLQELNEGNDLKKFICFMRNSFKKSTTVQQ